MGVGGGVGTGLGGLGVSAGMGASMGLGVGGGLGASMGLGAGNAAAAAAAPGYGIGAAAAAAQPVPAGMAQCPLPANADTVAALSWSPAGGPAELLAAGCWDGNAHLFRVQRTPQSVPTGAQLQTSAALGGPVLTSAWVDGTHLLLGGGNKQVMLWDLGSGAQPAALGQHAHAVSGLAWAPAMNLIISGGWDGKLCAWDPRQARGTPAGTIPLEDRVWCMDLVGNLLVVALANKKVLFFDLSKGVHSPFRSKAFDGPGERSIRAIKCWRDGNGMVASFSTSRVVVRYASEQHDSKQGTGANGLKLGGFSFPCHSEQSKGYAVHDVAMHPTVEAAFATGGADGKFRIWDRLQRRNCTQYMPAGGPINKLGWNANGDLLALATGNDWAQGAASPAHPTRLLLWQTTQQHLQASAKQQQGRHGYGR